MKRQLGLIVYMPGMGVNKASGLEHCCVNIVHYSVLFTPPTGGCSHHQNSIETSLMPYPISASRTLLGCGQGAVTQIVFQNIPCTLAELYLDHFCDYQCCYVCNKYYL